jgi:adenine-specific DNA-methyltransferase
VQQVNKEDKIVIAGLKPWPGRYINGEGPYDEGGKERRAAVFIGPEFGSVSRQDLVAAAKEAADADFDVLIACAFSHRTSGKAGGLYFENRSKRLSSRVSIGHSFYLRLLALGYNFSPVLRLPTVET